MAVNFGKVFGNAFRYSFSLKRILPFFLLNLIVVGVLFVMLNNLMTILPDITSVVGGLTPSLGGIMYFYLYLLIFFGIFYLIQLFFVGVIVHDAKSYPKKKRLSASFGIVKKKYLSILVASILVAIIVGIVSSIPILGVFLSLIFSWFFLFIVPFIVLGNKSAVDSIKESYKMFMKSKFDVFIYWLLLIIFGLALVLVSLIPIALSSVSLVYPLYQIYLEGTIDLTAITTILQQNLGYLLVGAIISAICMAYTTVFQESSKAFFYLQKKRR